MKTILKSRWICILALGIIHASHFAHGDEAEAPAFPGAFQVGAFGLSGHEYTSAFEAQATGIYFPFEDRSFQLGLRGGALLRELPAQSSWRAEMGLQPEIWLANTFGFGMAADGIFGYEFRLEPSLSLRMLRFRDHGAWSILIAAPYGMADRWIFKIGITLQWSGVP